MTSLILKVVIIRGGRFHGAAYFPRPHDPGPHRDPLADQLIQWHLGTLAPVQQLDSPVAVGFQHAQVSHVSQPV